MDRDGFDLWRVRIIVVYMYNIFLSDFWVIVLNAIYPEMVQLVYVTYPRCFPPPVLNFQGFTLQKKRALLDGLLATISHITN